MAQHDPRDVHFRSAEFLYRNWHYPKGWYFYDEEEDLYGPFLHEAQAKVGLQIYIRQLMAGKSPTQLAPLERQYLEALAEQYLEQLSSDPDIPDDLLQSIINPS